MLNFKKNEIPVNNVRGYLDKSINSYQLHILLCFINLIPIYLEIMLSELKTFVLLVSPDLCEAYDKKRTNSYCITGINQFYAYS